MTLPPEFTMQMQNNNRKIRKEERFVVVNGEEITHEMDEAEAAEFILDMVKSNEKTCFQLGEPEEHPTVRVTIITCV